MTYRGFYLLSRRKMIRLGKLENLTQVGGVFYVKLLSAVILVCMAWANPAFAQTPCEAVNSLLTTISTVRDIEADIQNEQFDANLTKLEGQVGNMFLPALFPEIDSKQFAAEQMIVREYIDAIQLSSELRGAGHLGGTGREVEIKLALGEAVSTQFKLALASIDNYWGCGMVYAPGGEVEDQSSNLSTQFGQERSRSNLALDRQSSIPRLSNASNRSSGVGNASQVTLNAMILDGASSLFLVISLIAAFAATVFLYLRHQAVQTVREARHLLYLPLISKIGSVKHPMVLVDISMNGGKLKHDQSIEGKPQIKLYVGRRWLSGQVKWSNSSYAGVLFKSPLTADFLYDVIHRESP